MSFTDPEYGRVGLTEAQAARQHDVVAGIARYDDLLRPDGRRLHGRRYDHRAGRRAPARVPTFTEAVCMAAQKICRTLGIGSYPQLWSYLGPED